MCLLKPEKIPYNYLIEGISIYMSIFDTIVDGYYAVKFKLEDVAYAIKSKLSSADTFDYNEVAEEPVKIAKKKKAKAKKKKK